MTDDIAEEQKSKNTTKLVGLVKKHAPEKVLVALGETYLASVDWSQINADVIYCKGKIGDMMHQFKKHLKSFARKIEKGESIKENTKMRLLTEDVTLLMKEKKC